jgi:hypothetical protein
VADRNILDDDGRTVIAQGDKITPESANAAADAGKLYDLWLAAQEAAVEH